MTAQNTHPTQADWYHEPFGCALPTGALTLLQMGVGDELSHFPSVVYPVVVDALQHGLGVVYVDTDLSLSRHGSYLHEVLNSPLLYAHQDDDITVYQPGPAGDHATFLRGHYYNCHLPTLHTTAAPLAAHEQTFGPSLVLFGDVACARPYLDIELIGTLEPGLPQWTQELSATDIARWRATDFLHLAQSRPQAPTVVVWCEGPENGLLELRKASALIVESTWTDGDADVEYRITLAGRDRLVAPEQLTLRAPLWDLPDPTQEPDQEVPF